MINAPFLHGIECLEQFDRMLPLVDLIQLETLRCDHQKLQESTVTTIIQRKPHEVEGKFHKKYDSNQ